MFQAKAVLSGTLRAFTGSAVHVQGNDLAAKGSVLFFILFTIVFGVVDVVFHPLNTSVISFYTCVLSPFKFLYS